MQKVVVTVCCEFSIWVKRLWYWAPYWSILFTYFYGILDFLCGLFEILCGQPDFLYGQLVTFYLANLTLYGSYGIEI